MAKFFYRMQNILNIKYKLEEQAKQEYREVQNRLNSANDVLNDLISRKNYYIEEYKNLTRNVLNVLEIEQCKNAILIMEDNINVQKENIKKIEKELEQSRQKLNKIMQDRKVHEKLKENQFEEFLKEINNQEMKEIDELVSYKYNDSEDGSEE